MKKFKLPIVLIISLLTLVGCGNSSKTKDKKVLRIGYPGTQSALSGVAGIAQEKGYINSYLKELGYSVEYIGFPSAGPGVNEALASNEIDIAIYSDFPGILIESKGGDTSLIGITDNYTNSAIIVSNDSDISSKDHKDITAQTVIVGNKEYLNKNEEAVVAFLKALIKGKEFLIENTDEGFDILTNTGYSKEVISTLMGKDDNKFDFVSLDITEDSIKKLETSKNFMLNNDIISKDFDINSWIDRSFYEKANK